MRVASHTLPIWSTWRAWDQLVHLLDITVLLSWWWTWRVEGLLVPHLLIVVVILMSVVGILVLIRCWQSSIQGFNSINNSNKHSTRSRVVSVDCWFYMNSSVIAFIMALTSLLLTHSSSLSPAAFVSCWWWLWWWWWLLLSLFWWHGEQKTKSNKLVID
jgi:hypothetical protein